MRAKKLILATLTILLSISIYSQNELEALRYSQMYWGGTARFVGSGGAFGAVGADFSALSTNPASMGVYKKSELSFTPTIQFSKAINNYNEFESEDFKYNFNIGNIGLVISMPLQTAEEKQEWKYVQFGMGINRIANYNNNILIEGENRQSSILDVFINKANGFSSDNLDPFDTQLAWETYLLNPSGANNYTSPTQVADLIQRKTINTSGSMNEWVFSLSGNYSDKLYLGATIGLDYFNYKENSFYEEIDRMDTMNGFRYLSIDDKLSTSGNGINFKFGFLYNPVEYIRFGGAIHTPTFFYSIKDSYSREMTSDLDTNTYSFSSPTLNFDYEINTPTRIMGNFAFLIQKSGFISFDYEYVDYSTSKLRSSDYSFVSENRAIKKNYTATHNFRLGAEYNLNSIVLRGGFSHYASPYKTTLNDASRNIISGGFGVRNKHYFLDFTFSRSLTKENYYLYDYTIVNASKQTIKTNNFIVSMGFKW